MADRHHLLVLVDLSDPRRHLAHRDKGRPFDARLCVLPWLAHVEEHWLLAALVGEPGGELARGDPLHRQKRKRRGCSAFASGRRTVSKRSTLLEAPGAVLVTRRACIAGASPTTAKRRPPGAS